MHCSAISRAQRASVRPRVACRALASHGGLLPDDPDPDGMLEYSVVYTDRALNHMSARYQNVQREISARV